jgi:hypothetical protein
MLLKKIVWTTLVLLAVSALPVTSRGIPTPKPTLLRADGVRPAPPPIPFPRSQGVKA